MDGLEFVLCGCEGSVEVFANQTTIRKPTNDPMPITALVVRRGIVKELCKLHQQVD